MVKTKQYVWLHFNMHKEKVAISLCSLSKKGEPDRNLLSLSSTWYKQHGPFVSRTEWWQRGWGRHEHRVHASHPVDKTCSRGQSPSLPACDMRGKLAREARAHRREQQWMQQSTARQRCCLAHGCAMISRMDPTLQVRNSYQILVRWVYTWAVSSTWGKQLCFCL